MKSFIILIFITNALSKKILDVSHLLDLEIKFHKMVYKADAKETIGNMVDDDFNATNVSMYGFGSLSREGPATVTVDGGNYLLEYRLSVPDFEMKIENLIAPSIGEFKNLSVKFENPKLRKVLEHTKQPILCKLVSGMEWVTLKGAKWANHNGGEAVDKFFDGPFRESLNVALLRISEDEPCDPIPTPFTTFV